MNIFKEVRHIDSCLDLSVNHPYLISRQDGKTTIALPLPGLKKTKVQVIKEGIIRIYGSLDKNIVSNFENKGVSIPSFPIKIKIKLDAKVSAYYKNGYLFILLTEKKQYE